MLYSAVCPHKRSICVQCAAPLCHAEYCHVPYKVLCACKLAGKAEALHCSPKRASLRRVVHLSVHPKP